MTACRLLMMGLPDSGKSTYVAALFHSLKEARAGMSLRAMPDEREYLLTLESKWLALEPVGHSAYPTPRAVQLPVVDDAGRAIDIDLPDVNGEEFRDAWESGEWSPPVQGLVEGAEGVLLFVRANDVRPPRLIEVGSSRQARETTKAKDWHPRLGVTQAKLCDLLEQIAEMRAGVLPPLALVVSAWDSVEADLQPEGWLEWRLPLLDQWLGASNSVDAFRVFGVSAQGGDLDDPSARDRLSKLSRTDRPGGFHALAEPLKWLLETL